MERQIISYITSDGEVSDLAECRESCSHRYRVRRPNCRIRYAMDFTGQESLVQQAHYDQTDINQVIERYRRTGVMPTGRQQGKYADVTALQGDPTELIERSREVIEKTAEFLRNYKQEAQKPPELLPANNSEQTVPNP